jgi:hypothetical protein
MAHIGLMDWDDTSTSSRFRVVGIRGVWDENLNMDKEGDTNPSSGISLGLILSSPLWSLALN